MAFLEAIVPSSADPLAAASCLASAGFDEEYVVYEKAGQWSFASGILAEISLDRSGARLRQEQEIMLPWDGTPLMQVQALLAMVPLTGWRAYGWAAFELAYAKDGDITGISDRRLLHLVVPRTEVRLEPGWAHVRSADQETLAAVTRLLSAEQPARHWEPSPVNVQEYGEELYRQAVGTALGDIKAGRLQKVILSRVVPVAEEIDLIGTYVCGRRGNNPARSFLLRLGGIEAAGFSPEIVVEVTDGGRVVTQPLAGTRALTPDTAENERLRTDLRSDPKEIYEHAISVQIACDEMRDLCAPDSVTVEEFMVIKERGSVQHLASRVAGQMGPGQGPWHAFGSAFPAVTASGVPKNAAYTCIRAAETEERGLYSGAVLTVDHDGSMDAALVLRAVYRQYGRTWLRAGAGIVGFSRPEREFEETCEKLLSVARFIVPASTPHTGPGHHATTS
jgi:salicylate synthase